MYIGIIILRKKLSFDRITYLNLNKQQSNTLREDVCDYVTPKHKEVHLQNPV